MKKEYLIYKLSEDLKEATRIENELFRKFNQSCFFLIVPPLTSSRRDGFSTEFYQTFKEEQ